ncbi:MAG: universal stress protein, partial [Methanomassiliicoccales archaeon]|nr:universal stress protein [Methanomassiliicoccales archaeon]
MKPFEKILIPTDGSDNAKAAVTQALTLAKLMDAEATALNVVDIGELYTRRGLRRADVDNYPLLEEEADAIVEQVRQEGERMGVAVKKLTRKGDPANEIVAISKDYDLIIMGTLG